MMPADAMRCFVAAVTRELAIIFRDMLRRYLRHARRHAAAECQILFRCRFTLDCCQLFCCAMPRRAVDRGQEKVA